MNGSKFAAGAAWARLGKTLVPAIIGLAVGCEGPAGPPGENGEPGENGAQGDEGAQGDDGAQGDPGAQGAEGAEGAEGAQGAQGEAGENGTNGDAGVDGENGEDGATGANGTDGVNGINGINGINGTNGTNGDDGEDGEDGRDGVDGVSGSGGGGDVTEAPTPGVAKVLALSFGGHDRFFGATYDSTGNLYAVGQISADVSVEPGNPLVEPDFSLLVAKFTPAGVLDETFGNGGVVVENVAIGGRGQENARGIVIQSTGKIVISGTAEVDAGDVSPFDSDTEVVLLRFNTDGALDDTFGTDGIAHFDLSTGIAGTDNNSRPTVLGRDTNWSLSLAANDFLVVHGSQRNTGGDGTLTDNDFALLRLNADGAPDNTFSGDGLVTLNLSYEEPPVVMGDPPVTVHTSQSARSATVLIDGSIIGVGYTTSSALGVSTQQPILYKVTPTGDFDPTYAVNDQWGQTGVWHDLASTDPALRVEAYAAAPQGTDFVTIGYGPTTGSGTGSDFISLRFNAVGERDLTYGTSGSGSTYVDGGGWGDNGRFVMVLPDERVLAVGAGRRAAAAQPEVDGMIALLDEDGVPDESFGSGGRRLYDMGGTSDHFWAAAISPTDFTRVAVVGIAGGAAASNDDDAALLILPVE